MSIVRETEYLAFQILQLSESGKTAIYNVLNRRSRGVLGEIRWYPAWRQYCFIPNNGYELVFSDGCLDDLSAFIKDMEAARRNNLKTSKE